MPRSRRSMRRTFEVGSGVDGFQSEAPLALSPSGRGWQREARPDEGGLSKAGARFAQTHPYPSPVRGRNRASMSIQRALNGVRTASRQSGRLDAAFDRKDAFLAERKPAAIDRAVADLANLGVGHDQDDIAASGGRERKQIRVEANRPLRTVAAHLAADVGPDFGRLAGGN